MNRPRIRRIGRDDAARAVSAQVMAFADDPIMRWLWPEAHAYVTHFPSLVEGFGGRAFDHGAAYASEDFFGGSLWLPPGVAPDEDALDALIREHVAEPMRSEVTAILEQMGESHPHEKHWHLAFIGVDTAHQSKGIGAAVLQHTLAEIDEQGLHAYLESSNPGNIPFYERHGFEVLREIRVGGSPPVFPMLRVPH